MTAPVHELVQYEYQNPDASKPLIIPMLVICNTSDEDLSMNVKANTALDLRWVMAQEPLEFNSVAIMVGGGGSVEEYTEEIEKLQKNGGTVFAMNAASKWVREQGIEVDYQVIADAKRETATLVDPYANDHLLASQVHPETMGVVRATNEPFLWHLETGNIEKDFPAEKKLRGGYALIGGGASVGNSAICVAFTLGFRELHIFGYDSCHSGNRSHAYPQPMNDRIPCVTVEWGGKKFKSSVAMKAQAEKFQMTSQALKQAGCSLHVYGDGLLQTMYTTPPKNLTEQQKYQTMWQFDSYREISPGELQASYFLNLVKPDGMIIDYGCGTGRAGLAFDKAGLAVLLMDFAPNCRDEEAMKLPFIQWDLTRPIPSRSEYGYCTDVMEHIPPDDVMTVLGNIMKSSKKVFFQISTIDDVRGDLIGAPLHLSVHSHNIWLEWLSKFGVVAWAHKGDIASLFYAIRE